MKGLAFVCAICAAATLSCNALAQTNAPASSKGLNAGDNVQDAPSHKSTHTKKVKAEGGHRRSSTHPGGTATPSGPGAPVSASGSGQ